MQNSVLLWDKRRLDPKKTPWPLAKKASLDVCQWEYDRLGIHQTPKQWAAGVSGKVISPKEMESRTAVTEEGVEIPQLHTSLHLKLNLFGVEKFLTVDICFWQSKRLVVSERISSSCEKAPPQDNELRRPGVYKIFTNFVYLCYNQAHYSLVCACVSEEAEAVPYLFDRLEQRFCISGST